MTDTRDSHTWAVNHRSTDEVSLAERLRNCLGESRGGARLISDRRGSHVYRLQFRTGDVALKLTERNASEQGVRRAEHLARREAAVLTQLCEFIPGYLIDSGDLRDGGSWIAARWLDGITP